MATDAYSANLKMEKVSLSAFKPLPVNEEQYPLEYIEANYVIKLKEHPDRVYIGICNPDNKELVENLKVFHNKAAVFYQVEKSELSAYLGEVLSRLDKGGTYSAKYRDDKISLDKLANDAPIVNLVNSLMIEAIRKNASDIHIECFSEKTIARYRIDGYLQTVLELERERFPAISSRIKIMSNLNIMEKRLPQDGRISVNLEDDVIDLRVSIVPIADGESIVLRIFNKQKTLLNLDQIGLGKKDYQKFNSLLKHTHGLILVTGPTGSGKTTTLNSVLRKIKSHTTKIISIEDPIEYIIDGIDQIQTNDRIGLTFDSLLRRVLRQDPNIIMVGEIRDSQTAELAIRAALTGHLVFSTLHTNDSVSVITRLKNMGIEAYLLAAVFRGSLAQRLVRRICNKCKYPDKPTSAEKKILSQYGITTTRVFRGKGCSLCNNTGYKGRVGIFEICIPDEKVEEMIVQNKRDNEIKDYLISRGMQILMETGLRQAVAGVTTISEVERVITV
jgi:general secretion pathway protein E